MRLSGRGVVLAFAGLLVVFLAQACGQRGDERSAAAALPERVDYNFHVKPILSDRCYACHGPDENKRKAGLRLDTEEGARGLLESGRRAIVPGSPRRSEVARRIRSRNPEVAMPPAESNLHLSDAERATILRWIEQGAEFKPHWSLIPPERREPPQVAAAYAAAVNNDIDRFILSRLDQEGIGPAAEADRERLIRRVTFDLTGLPPTLDEIDAFVADSSSDAYERVVDRLLASPAYGEHMAAAWLDLARYADSHGYQDDGLRNMWPWRDWVIRAFNKNMPYDEFVTVQLAGDLLPAPTRDELLATGFNRNHLQSQEGGIVPEEYRVDYVADRTNTFGRAFLGITVECARCHDHKYDPISQEEYYQLFAFFNSVKEFGNIPYAGEASPTVILTSAAADSQLAVIASRTDSLEKILDPSSGSYDPGFRRWVAGLNGNPPRVDLAAGRIGHFPFDDANDRVIKNVADAEHDGYVWGDADKEPIIVDGAVGSAIKLVGDPWLDMGKDFAWFERNEPFSLALWAHIPNPTAGGRRPEGPLLAKSGGLFNGLRGYVALLNADGTLSVSLNHVFPANSIEIETVEPLPTGRWVHLAVAYDGSSRADGLRLFVDGESATTYVKADNLKMSILYQVDPRTKQRSNWGDPGNLRLGWIESNFAQLDSVSVDDLMVYDRELTRLDIRAIVGGAPGSREFDAPDSTLLREYYVSRVDPRSRKARAELAALRGQENEILTRQPEVMVMGDLDTARPTFVLDRGAYDAPKDRVEPNAPASLLEYDESLPADRRGLARWLLDERHPLTARVAVNRMWQRFFGTGLVPTSDDFGNQGARPTHPELLDWLALEFIDSGWDVKAFQKLIAMSATYRQSSIASDETLELDPANELLARGPTKRLSAEQVRDNALAASGLLSRKVGGEPVKPYQPAGLWKELATRNATVYEQDSGEKLYRRSLYTIWKRTTPPPSMVSFDAADRDVCTVRRQATNTPMQALILLNDPQYVEASRVLAEAMIKETSDPAERIENGFRLLATRRPRPVEVETLLSLLDEQRLAFKGAPRNGRSLLAVGEYPRDETLDAAEVAAYTVVMSTIMSFDESVILR